MGNPKKYYFENKFVIRMPEIDESKKLVNITSVETNFINHFYDKMDNKFLEHYDTAIVDFYSAPDLIMSYSNGNTSKDEWRRYVRYEFKNLDLLNLLNPDCYGNVTAIFSFDEFKNVFDDTTLFLEGDIPLGKFRGMTLKEVDNYKRKNFIKFKDWKPCPSKEAIKAACAVSSLAKEAIIDILVAAYEVDL